MEAKKKVTARANQQRKTFTLREYDKHGVKVKIRTLPMDTKTFALALAWSSEQWGNFLLHTEEYYVVE